MYAEDAQCTEILSCPLHSVYFVSTERIPNKCFNRNALYLTIAFYMYRQINESERLKHNYIDVHIMERHRFPAFLSLTMILILVARVPFTAPNQMRFLRSPTRSVRIRLI